MGAINVQETPGVAEVSIPQGGSRAGTACGSSAGPLWIPGKPSGGGGAPWATNGPPMGHHTDIQLGR